MQKTSRKNLILFLSLEMVIRRWQKKTAADSKEGKGSVDKNSTAFLVVVLINSLRVALMLHSGFGTRKVCKCDVLRNRKSTEQIFDFVLYFFLYE